jgi:hypothetical protein
LKRKGEKKRKQIRSSIKPIDDYDEKKKKVNAQDKNTELKNK